MTADDFNDGRINRLIESALMEDAGLGDVTSDAIVPEEQRSEGVFLCKEDGIVAGVEVAAAVFALCDRTVSFQPLLHDGRPASRKQVIARINGSTRGILLGERIALNFMQRMCGIATLTRRFVDAVAGTSARITDTRKTVPGLRVLDKWAVRIGGGVNHRFGLDDMVLIKDNHILTAGGITRAVHLCRNHLEAKGLNIPIEVETKNLDEVREVMALTGIVRIMLDNFAVADMKRAVEIIAHSLEVEASGGVSLDTVRPIAETGVDFISIGALTHSVKALDLSLDLTRNV